MFSLSVKTYDGNYVFLEIMRDGELIAEALGDAYNSEYATGAAFVVVECEAGQVVWVSSGEYEAYLHGTSERQSLFTGYMLYGYE